MAHDKLYPTGYARHLIILNEKESKDSAPKATSVKFPNTIMIASKSAYVNVSKAKSVKEPTAKAVESTKAKDVKAPKSAKTDMSNISEPE